MTRAKTLLIWTQLFSHWTEPPTANSYCDFLHSHYLYCICKAPRVPTRSMSCFFFSLALTSQCSVVGHSNNRLNDLMLVYSTDWAVRFLHLWPGRLCTGLVQTSTALNKSIVERNPKSVGTSQISRTPLNLYQWDSVRSKFGNLIVPNIYPIQSLELGSPPSLNTLIQKLNSVEKLLPCYWFTVDWWHSY